MAACCVNTKPTSWSAFRDYIYRGTQLLASAHSAEGVRHFHLDHLGTPRLVTAGGTGGDFYTLTPCRVLDTRNQSAPLAAGETRTVPMVGSWGIPGNAATVAVNITVVDATTDGEMTAYPANESRPATSAISYQLELTRGNNGILKLGHGAPSSAGYEQAHSFGIAAQDSVSGFYRGMSASFLPHRRPYTGKKGGASSSTTQMIFKPI